MKKLLYSGLAALMMVFSMTGSAVAQEETSFVNKVEFTPASGSTITAGDEISFSGSVEVTEDGATTVVTEGMIVGLGYKLFASAEEAQAFTWTFGADDHTFAASAFTAKVTPTKETPVVGVVLALPNMTAEEDTDPDVIYSEVFVASYTVEEDETGFVEPNITLSFTPADGASITDGDEITLTYVNPDNLSEDQLVFGIAWNLFATKDEAKAYTFSSTDDEMYNERNKPVPTAEKPVVAATIAFVCESCDEGMAFGTTHVAEYTFATSGETVAAPMISTSSNVVGDGVISKKDSIFILSIDDDAELAFWYTTDGSTPEAEGENSTKYEKGFLMPENAKTVKAIAVKDGVSSDVTTATYKYIEDMTATMYVGNETSTVGKYTPVYTEVYSDDYFDGNIYMVVYTTDGETEPDLAAYLAQEGEGVQKMQRGGMVNGPNEERVYSYFMINEPTKIMCKGYLQVGERDDIYITTDMVTLDYTTIQSTEAPEFETAAGAVEEGTVVKIKNNSTNGTIYYTVDGTNPTWDRYEFTDAFGTSIFRYDDAVGITISKRTEIRAICYADPSEEGEGGDMPTVGGYPIGSDIISATYTVIGQVEAPVFDPAAGEVVKGTKVSITCATEDAVIYYTLDGEEPTEESTEFTEAIEITEDVTIKAIAIAGNYKSDIVTAAYTIKEVSEVAAPTFEPGAGEVAMGTKVTIACATEGAVIYYTLDGEEPTEESTEYTEAIEINKALTIKAIAILGGVKSDIAEAAYTIETANEGEELAGVSIYPNPSNGEFNLVVPVRAEVAIFASNGVMVKQMTVAAGTQKIRLENSGIFFVRIAAENGQAAVKRVIVR